MGDVKYKDINGDGVIDPNDKTFIGNPHPDFTFGFTNNFKYKNIEIESFKNSLTDFSSFLKNNYFTATASIMFRPSVLKNYPNFHNEIFAGDFVLKYAEKIDGE